MSATWTFQPLGAAGSAWECSEQEVSLNVVFVHGFIGDHLETWSHSEKKGMFRKEKTSVRLVDLLTSDPEPLSPCHFFSVAHKAGITSPTDLDKTAGLIRSFVRSYLDGPEPIAFVTHSFGGLACRQAILDMLDDEDERDRVLSLLMLGTPNSGTEIARVAKFLGSSAGGNMEPFNHALEVLNRRWTKQVVNEGHPDEEAEKRALLLCWSAVGTEDRIVPPASAAALASFSSIEYLNKDHSAVCKARDRDDPTYRLVRRFIDESVARIPMREGKRAVLDLTHGLRRDSLAGRWVSAEAEHITLTEDADESLLRCRVRNVREGGLTKRRFNFCVWLPGHWPGNRSVDYGWEIGRGILNDPAFARLSGSLNEGFDEFFRVDALQVTQHGKPGNYTEVSREIEAGWVVLEFESPKWVLEGQPYDKLEIELESWVDRRQGWYLYESPRTVARRLEVTLTAPFKARPINNLGSRSKIEETILTKRGYLHRVTVDGPVPLDRNLTWIYPHLESEAATQPGDDQGSKG